MAKKKVPIVQKLTHLIYTKVNDEKYNELKKLLDANPANNMGRLVRDILYKTPIKIITFDKTLDVVVEEFTKIRSELNAIGVNINQITHMFNTYPEPQRKLFFAKIAIDRYVLIEEKIDRLFSMLLQIERKWWSASEPGNRSAAS